MKVLSGAGVAAVVQGAGSLVVQGRFVSLEVTSALEPSAIANLSVEEEGVLTGGAEVQVTNALNAGTNGFLLGTGSLVIVSGASGTITHSVGTGFIVEHETIRNAGTLTVGKDVSLAESGGAQLINSGVLIVNSERPSSGGIGGSSASITNTGTIEKTEGSGTSPIEPAINNEGTVLATSGILEFMGGGTTGAGHPGTWSASGAGTQLLLNTSGTFSLGSSVTLTGAVEIVNGTVKAGVLEGASANLTINGHGGAGVGSLNLEGSGASVLHEFVLTDSEGRSGGVLKGSGELDITASLSVGGYSTIEGSGTVVVEPGAVARSPSIGGSGVYFVGRRVVNEGTFTIGKESGVEMLAPASFINFGTLVVNGEPEAEAKGLLGFGTPGLLENYGRLIKTAGGGVTPITTYIFNYGEINAEVGSFSFSHPVAEEEQTFGGEENPATPNAEIEPCGEGVGCSSGNYSQTQTDFSVGGRGVGLALARTYNSQAAANGAHGIFGYGWTSSFSDHLAAEPTGHVTLKQANGGSVVFAELGSEKFSAPAWTQDTLTGSSSTGYVLTLEDQTVYRFAGSSGRLESVTDRNGNATTLTYTGEGRLEKITDPAGRTIKLAYNGEGLVESAEDPMKHVVKYTYEGGNLATVTQPAEAGLRWQFKYDASHQLTELTDGRGGHSHIEYSAQHRVTSQKDPLERQTTFEYPPFRTVTTNHATGAVTAETFTSTGLPLTKVHGYGTASATTETFTYDASGGLLSTTDGNGHTTKYQYDTHENRTLSEDPEGHKTKWTFDATHDVETETKPNGETTTYKRDSHGNPEVIERPAPSATIQSTSYKYDTHGNPESMTDPLKHVWKYEYDVAGDKTAETDPEGDKRTWAYNENSQETSTVSPRGHVKAGEEAKYTTTTERDAQGRAIKVTDPLKHETKYTYDADGNLETKTDPELNKTTYTYDADNERTKTKEPSGLVTETGYDGAGQVTSQADGNKHTTKYERNILEQISEVIDPRGRKTLKEYDKAGNLTAVIDPLKRTTTYRYNSASRSSEVTYSDGITPAVKYEYNANGDRIQMTDGTGTTTYEYDQLDRLIATKDGHGSTAGYEYDLANEQTKIIYPTSKAVTNAYDGAGRLKSVTDWSEHVTKYAYNADGVVKAITFPTGTGNEDAYSYDETDAMKEVKMTKGAETVASLVYTRNKDGLTSAVTSKGLPGEEKPAFSYDANSRLSKGTGTAYKYDEGNSPTTIGSTTYKYDAASELEKAEVAKVTTATYAYDELGERTKTTPTSGAATTYGYNQAERLTSVNRPKSGETPAIEDSYAYNGDRLRVSRTASSSTSYYSWDLASERPILLADSSNSYIYGAGLLPIEQVSSEGTVLYLHHDQQGSTRVLTGSSGAVSGTETFDAYGNKIGSTGVSVSPLGYDGEYFDSDTGLIYLRARYYEPGTSQLLSRDPATALTAQPYAYAADDPMSASDPSGECPDAVAARVPGYRKPPPCRGHIQGPERISRFSVQTSPTPTVTWGLEFTGKFLAQLRAEGYVTVGVSFSSATRVNGRLIKGPGPKGNVEAGYTYHGSVGPKIFGNTRVKFGDLIELHVWATGTATNVKGGIREFSAEASALCTVG